MSSALSRRAKSPKSPPDGNGAMAAANKAKAVNPAASDDQDIDAATDQPLLSDDPSKPTQHDPSLHITGTGKETAYTELPNIVLLIFLYALQGVPLGLTFGSIPFLLQSSSSSSYTSLGLFSLASWPYSLKLLWSPIVDCYYVDSIGRRKSWIAPMQVLIGGALVVLSYHIDSLITHVQVYTLTAIFFLLITAVATQDIAVDGWALSLLPTHLLSYASTCQSIGQNIGYFLSYSVFLALNNASFSNQFRGLLGLSQSTEPLIALSSYMMLWGVLFLLSTAYLLLFKHEAAYVPTSESDHGVTSLYKQIYHILTLPPIQQLVVVLLTSRLAFTAADNITVLKLTEYGFPKEHMAVMVFFLFPFELVFPVIVGGWTASGNALRPWLVGYPMRMCISLLGLGLVGLFPTGGTIGWWYYGCVLGLQLLYSLSVNVLFVSQCAFFSRISDVRIGGTYMTLLNTLANLGSTWPKFFIFWLVDEWTCKAAKRGGSSEEGSASGGGVGCLWYVSEGSDGYYSVSLFCFVIGCVWFWWMRSRVLGLGELEKRAWLTDTANSR